jgi:hypothetical protein
MWRRVEERRITQDQHGATSQKTAFFIVTAVKTSNLTYQEIYFLEYKPCYLFHSGFFLGLFFGSEDGGDIFLRNVIRLSTDYIALFPRRGKFS